MAKWNQLEPNVFALQDSCIVYAVKGPSGLVLINAGTGLAADCLDEIAKGSDVTVLLTHHFRDHSAGAKRLHEAGARIIGPYWEMEYLVDPEQHFRTRQVWNSYDNRWDRFSPLAALPVDDWAMDYETREHGGLSWEVVPTPAHSNGAVSYLVELNGHKLGFTGEIITDYGKTSRVAPFQYNYNDLTGAFNLWHVCAWLRGLSIDTLYPSFGHAITEPNKALAALQTNVEALGSTNPGLAQQLSDPVEDGIEVVIPGRLYRSKQAAAVTNFVISRTGKVLSIDYGYAMHRCFSPGTHHRSNRRSLLHGVAALKEQFGIERIDTVLVSHFHDDHVNGIPMLQRLYGTEVWAGDVFADLLERPMRYDRPCLWHEPIDVTRHLPCGETIEWEDIRFTLYPMSGHTRFSTLICMEIDDLRVVHTGDQIFFASAGGLTYSPDATLFTNHVYKNGLDLGCYVDTWERLAEFKPDWVLTGHTIPYQPDERWLDIIAEGAKAFDDGHTQVMALGDGDCHFGAESQAGKLKPYHVHQQDESPISYTGWVLNPFSHDATAEIGLCAPDGWSHEKVSLELAGREQKSFALSLRAPAGTQCRRQPIGLELTVDGRPFGAVAESLVTIGHEFF